MKTRTLFCALALPFLLGVRASASTLLIADWIGYFTTGAVKAVDSTGLTPHTPYLFNGPGGVPSFPRGITIGPDGNVYVGNEGTARVERYSPSGAFIDVFIPDNGGDVLNAHRVKFGPDGNFYVGAAGSLSGFLPSRIHKFDGITGADLGEFTTGGLGLSNPHGFTWGPDGNLYVCSPTDGVNKYNGTTGAYISTFLFASGSPAFFPMDVLFDADGNLLVVNNDLSGSVLKFNGITGAPMGTLISTGSGISELQRPESILLGPDGMYYIGNNDKGNVLRYLTDGTFVDVYATGGGLLTPTAMAFLPPVPEPAMLGIALFFGAAMLRRR